MRHLFIVRHGDYDFENLTNYGRKQIEKVAERMKAIIGEVRNGHYLLSSTAPRAEQSAEIIGRVFGIDTDKNDKIWTNGGDLLYKDELEEIDSMIVPHEGNDVMTIVTHYEVVGSYPHHFIKTRFGKDDYIKRPEKGEGIHIDIEKRTHQFMPD